MTIHLFPEILADRQLSPAALCLHPQCIGVGEPSIPPEIQAALDDMARRLPCVVAETAALPEAVQVALRAVGAKPLKDGTCLSLEEPPSGKYEPPPGVALISGNWYLKPPTRPGTTQSASRTLALRLLQLVSTDAPTPEIEEVLRHDPAMSFHLLRLVNSLSTGGKRITSFAQAILILGRRQLRRWLNLMLFAARKDDPRAPMLMARVSTRAQTMELLARAAGLDKAGQEAAFMVGMFSLLDALLGQPLAELLAPLNLGPDLEAALLRQEGELGRLLVAVLAAECRDAAALEAGLAGFPVAAHELGALQLAALHWMLDLTAGTGHD